LLKLGVNGAELASDEGYFAVGELAILREMEVRTVISDPPASRRRRDLPTELRKVLCRAHAAVQSQSGEALLCRSGEHLERGFCHVLDHGGRRRATVRGCAKLTKAYSGTILGHNLSVLMRHLHGCGPRPQTMGGRLLFGSLALAVPHHRRQRAFAAPPSTRRPRSEFLVTHCRLRSRQPSKPGFSTGC
jgi:hypothetical protein